MRKTDQFLSAFPLQTEYEKRQRKSRFLRHVGIVFGFIFIYLFIMAVIADIIFSYFKLW